MGAPAEVLCENTQPALPRSQTMLRRSNQIWRMKMRKFSLFVAAFALAAGAFWTTMLTSPPQSEAASVSQIDTRELTLKSHLEVGESYDTF